MDGMSEPLPGLLDDPQFQFLDLPISNDHHVRIAPLRDPAPLRSSTFPSPLEPNAPEDVEATRSKAKLAGRHKELAGQSKERQISTPKITPADILNARDAIKKSNVSLTISELVGKDADAGQTIEPRVQQFVSLSAVEKSYLPSPTYLIESRKRPRLDFEDGERPSMQTQDDYIHLPMPLPQEPPLEMTAAPLLPVMLNGIHEPPKHMGILPSMDKQNSNHSPTAMLSIKSRGATSVPRPPEKMLNSPVVAATKKLPADITKASSPLEQVQTILSNNLAPPLVDKARKLRSKWSEAETKSLLEGVQKYGLSKWSEILEDTGFTFDQRRRPGDLKDRFRNLKEAHHREKEIEKVISPHISCAM